METRDWPEDVSNSVTSSSQQHFENTRTGYSHLSTVKQTNIRADFWREQTSAAFTQKCQFCYCLVMFFQTPCDFLFFSGAQKKKFWFISSYNKWRQKLSSFKKGLKIAVKKSLKMIFFFVWLDINKKNFLSQSYRMASEVCFCVLFEAPSPIYVCKKTTSTFSFCFWQKGLGQWQNGARFICARTVPLKLRAGWSTRWESVRSSSAGLQL